MSSQQQPRDGSFSRAHTDVVLEIYRIVSSKALDQGEQGPGPGEGHKIPLGPSNPPGDAKKSGQCC